MSKSKKLQIVIRRRATLDTIRTSFGSGHDDPMITVSRCAWQCPLCRKWEEYTEITCTMAGESQTHVAKGCGGASHFYEGNRIDHCNSSICNHKADVMLGVKP